MITAAMVSEVFIHEFAAEASELGWAPGVPWPMTLPTELGNGQPFVLTRATADGAVYRQSAGCIVLHVFND